MRAALKTSGRAAPLSVMIRFCCHGRFGVANIRGVALATARAAIKGRYEDVDGSGGHLLAPPPLPSPGSSPEEPGPLKPFYFGRM